jgi:hypothetical protein
VLSLNSFIFSWAERSGRSYGFGVSKPTLLASPVVIIGLGFICARLLQQIAPGGNIGRTAWRFGRYPLQQPNLALAGI